jgi:hypothetical protein
MEQTLTEYFAPIAKDRISRGKLPLDSRIVMALDEGNPGFAVRYAEVCAPFLNTLTAIRLQYEQFTKELNNA